ncbi:MAG: glycosyltransferase family 4 protein [Flavobacteriales bacterium]
MALRILLLADGIPPFVMGGMQKHSLQLAEQLARLGNRVSLYHFTYSVVKEREVRKCFSGAANENLEVKTFLYSDNSVLPGHYLRSQKRMSRIYWNEFLTEDGVFDFIYAKGFMAWSFLKERNGIGLNTPIGIKFHGYEMFQKAPSIKVRMQHMMLRQAVKWCSLNADVVFSYGGKISDIISDLGVESGRILEAPSGIEASFVREKLPPIKDGGPVSFCFVGRNERRKGINELTHALQRMLASSSEFRFHFIGPIPEGIQLKDERITYHGVVTNMEGKKEILDACDVLVCPSYSEGMPNVILEGMARGLAIIATDVGAVSAIVDNENGVLLPFPSSPSLFRAMSSMVAVSKDSLDEMKRGSLERIWSGFLWDQIGVNLNDQIQRKVSHSKSILP